MYVCGSSMIDEYANPLSMSEWDGAGRTLACEDAHAWHMEADRLHEPSSSQRQCTTSGDVVIA